ncbi:LOW QUALITY PROTEIN: hypothetical protein CVT25_009256 [Psilocybe cyanescens]|uniref:Nephrocystin 3-like N-terminal domain-containing protein n=1 Tax=Psilocybe cyanescens TaxID=93625 RepID=A0A409XTH1_PSICY|nr:LOW QUALITY PROTEIN: hypothetical protein CVT25_009256 [Psilocybe cyanescens]
MFKNTNNMLISGGTFTDHHHGASLVSIQNAGKSAIERLMEAASLGAFHNSGKRFDPPKCHPNTRTAVLQRLMDWYIGEVGLDMFVLWLYGPAGAGKSAIAQTFAEHCATINGLLASFFFSRSDPRRNNDKALVATLAYQVWLRISESRSIIQAAIDNDPAIFELNFETQFQTLILDTLLQLSGTGLFTSEKSFPYLIIIDGLDECKDSDVQNTILNTISNTLQRHRTILPFKYLIASRPEHHLTIPFCDASLNSLTFRFALDDTYQPDEDIKLYLMDSFRNIREKHIMRSHLPDSWPSDEDIAVLVAKSSGQFIYAATVVRYLSSTQHNPLDRLKVIQGLLPVNNDRPYAQLDALYSNILSGVGDIEATLRVLGVYLVMNKINYPMRTLSVEKLEQFMLLDPGVVQLLLIDLPSVVDVSNEKAPVKFLHASFSDFLFDSTRMHEEVSRLCVTHVNMLWSIDYDSPREQCTLAHREHHLVSTGRNTQFSADPHWELYYAYGWLVSHLEQAGPLHDNATLREEIFDIFYVQFWTNKNLRKSNFLRNAPLSFKFTEALAKFLHFLQVSSFRDPEELYLHHRKIWDQQMREDLTLVPMSPGLAFWAATCVGMNLERVVRDFRLETLMALPSSSSASDRVLSVPISFFTADFFDGMAFTVITNSRGALRIDQQYLAIVAHFLTDPSRAGPHVICQPIYIMAAEYAIAFAVGDWNEKKTAITPSSWTLIWDALTFILSTAGYSNKVTGKQCAL